MKKKLLSILLIIAMIATCFPASAFAAQSSGTASTLRLEKTEGTVAVENASGKDMTVKNGLRLYNGYGVETKSSSYAWISLDKAKAIKLDASSKSSVSKNGKKLEVLMHSGKMFCNVSEPLKADESLTIRTSTMVTGVRGTSLYIEVLSDNTVQLSVLEGSMDVYSIDPATEETRVTTVTGGQTITLVYDGEIPEELIVDGLIKDGEIAEDYIIFTGVGLRVEELQEKDVPGYVAVEIANDPELQEKIENNSPLSVPEIIGDAQERLDADEKEAEAEEEAIQEQLEQQEKAEEVDNLFGEQTSSSSGGGSSSSSSDTLTGTVTAAQIYEAWNTYDVVNLSYATFDLTADETFEVLADKTLDLESGTTVTNNGDITITGTMNVNSGAKLVNDGGNIIVNSTKSLHINESAELTNDGIINVGYTSAGAMTVAASAKVINNGGIEVGGEASETANSSMIIESNAIIDSTNENCGAIIHVYANSSMESAGTILNHEVLNQGQMNFTGGYVNIDSSDTVTNGCLSNDGDATLTISNTKIGGGYVFNVESGEMAPIDSVSNYGTLTMESGEILNTTNNGIYNYGDATINDGTITSTVGCAIYNLGTVRINDGTISTTSEEFKNAISNYISADAVPGVVSIYGGEISSTTGTGVDNMGTLVVNPSSKSIKISGGQQGITNISDRDTDIIASATIVGGTISGVKTAGILNGEGSKVTISGGDISSESGYGLQNSGTAIIDKGTISGMTGIYNSVGLEMNENGTVLSGLSIGSGATIISTAESGSGSVVINSKGYNWKIESGAKLKHRLGESAYCCNEWPNNGAINFSFEADGATGEAIKDDEGYVIYIVS